MLVLFVHSELDMKIDHHVRERKQKTVHTFQTRTQGSWDLRRHFSQQGGEIQEHLIWYFGCIAREIFSQNIRHPFFFPLGALHFPHSRKGFRSENMLFFSNYSFLQTKLVSCLLLRRPETRRDILFAWSHILPMTVVQRFINVERAFFLLE